MRIRRLHVVINPAAGKDTPVLDILNEVFQKAGIDWEVSVTKGPGEARRLAREAAESGVDAVAAYGGDGTVSEVASGMIGSEVPLAILPGGTANVMATELGIPAELRAACALLSSPDAQIRAIDMGEVDGATFLLRVGIGLEAAMVEGADREVKERVGPLAYLLSALRALQQPQRSRYELSLDGQEEEAEGVTCIVANSANLGISGVSLHPDVDVADGLLDVFVLRQADLDALLALASSAMGGEAKPEALQHWQAREIAIEADPAQSVQADGEIMAERPVRIEVRPQALRVIGPAGKVQERAANDPDE